MAKKVYKNLAGRRIRQRRKYEELSQEELTEIIQSRGLNLKRDVLSKIEVGERCLSDVELNEIAQTLNVDIYWLLGIADEPGKYGKIQVPITKNYMYKEAKKDDSE